MLVVLLTVCELTCISIPHDSDWEASMHKLDKIRRFHRDEDWYGGLLDYDLFVVW